MCITDISMTLHHRTLSLILMYYFLSLKTKCHCDTDIVFFYLKAFFGYRLNFKGLFYINAEMCYQTCGHILFDMTLSTEKQERHFSYNNDFNRLPECICIYAKQYE